MPSKFTFRPPTFEHLPVDRLGIEIDKHLPRLFDAHASLNSTAVKAPAFAAGFATVSGNLSVTGSKTGIATGLTTVTNATASINNGATATNFWVTCRPSPTVTGGIDIYVWKPTAAGDNTPIAATTAVTVHWTASGQAETTT